MKSIVLILSTFVFSSLTQAAIPDRLAQVRAQVVELEKGLLQSLHNNRDAKVNLTRIQTLINLQKQEKKLGSARIQELEKTIQELETRRIVLRERVEMEQATVRKAFTELHRMGSPIPQSQAWLENEKIEQPRAKVLSNLVQMGVREIEALKVDIQDADSLEARITEERGTLDVMIHEMAESEGILELNRQLQIDVIQKTHQERLSQLEKYRNLKAAETQVSDLIKNFNARVELQEVTRTEKSNQRAMIAMANADFARFKGKLPFPAPGKIVGQFGKGFDASSQLTVFKKGIDIDTGQNQPIRSVFRGKVAYSGELPNYGRMLIIDHGDHFYSLCGKLGALNKKVGDIVAAGEEIGASDQSGTPVYFEIRARNIPVNPLQWVSN